MNSAEPCPITRLFAEHGLRCTKQRKAVYRALNTADCHPTADMLYRLVLEQDGDARGISLATVYNATEALVKAGLARKLAGNDGTARYDAMCHNHLHLVSESTGAVRDVPGCLGDKLLKDLCPDALKKIEAELGFSIHKIHIELVGDYTGDQTQV